MPASNDWPFGRYNTVLFTDGTPPGPGLGGTVPPTLGPFSMMLTSLEGFELAQI